MWLKLDLDGIIFQLQIRGYRPSTKENWDDNWCRVSLSLTSRNWLDYSIREDEVLLSAEIETLAEDLSKLLNDDFSEILETDCIEPDFRFKLHPKKDLRDDPKYTYVQEGYEIEDISMEWIISFWDGGLTDNFLSLKFCRDDIKYLSNYLNIVMGEIDKQNEIINQMINKGVLYGF